MAKFIEPPIEKAKVRFFEFDNFSVNIELVTGLQKRTHYVASDGFWSVLEPVIKFHGTDIMWHFGEGGEKERDLCYDQLMLEFKNNNHE